MREMSLAQWFKEGPPMDITQYILDQFPPGYLGTAVDVGANDGVFLSKTLPLERLGWRVLCVEPNPHYTEALRANRKEAITVACAAEDAEDQDFHLVESNQNQWAANSSLHPIGGRVKEVVKVTVRRLDRLLTEAGFTSIDVVQTDCEGGDLDVLRGLDLTMWHPRVIIVEPSGVDMNAYLSPLGYELIIHQDDDEVYLALNAPV